jgi:hypothetical protein
MPADREYEPSTSASGDHRNSWERTPSLCHYGCAVAGCSDWRDAVGAACLVGAIALMVTTLGAPIVEDRAEWIGSDPSTGPQDQAMGIRSIRRAVTSGEAASDPVNSPAGVDLEQLAFY